MIIDQLATEVFTQELLDEFDGEYSPEVLSGLFLGVSSIAVQILLEPRETAYLSLDALNMIFQLRKEELVAAGSSLS